jgi:pimeloyl-ACP methyl ester carboxylesterase
MDGIYWTRGARERVLAGYRTLLATSPVSLREVRIPTRFGETGVLTCGPSQGPPLVLLHGGNTNSSMWITSLPAWSKHFRVYAVDTIGDPGLSATTRPSFHTDDHARWLSDVLKALNVERANIAGASLGGWIGLDFALRYPTAVGRLVLFAPGGITRIRIATALEISCLMLLGAWGRRRALLSGFSLLDARLTDDQCAFLDFCGITQLNALSRIRIPALIADERLKTLSVPTRVVLGGRDKFFDPELVQRRFHDLCPAVTVQVVPEAGHIAVNPTGTVQDFFGALTAHDGA